MYRKFYFKYLVKISSIYGYSFFNKSKITSVKNKFCIKLRVFLGYFENTGNFNFFFISILLFIHNKRMEINICNKVSIFLFKI